MAIPAQPPSFASMSLRRIRALAVLAAVAGPSAIWLIGALLGHRLEVTQGGTTLEVTLPMVIGTSLAASLAGWGLLAALERRTRRARMIWAVVATAVLIASLAGPLTAVATATTKLTLSLMHVCAGVVLIPALARATGSPTTIGMHRRSSRR